MNRTVVASCAGADYFSQSHSSALLYITNSLFVRKNSNWSSSTWVKLRINTNLKAVNVNDITVLCNSVRVSICVFVCFFLAGFRLCDCRAKLCDRRPRNAQFSQRWHHQAAGYGRSGEGWDACVHVVEILLSSKWIYDPSVCLSSRLYLRLCGEEESGVFGGAEKRHCRLWWVFINSQFN